MNAAQAYGLKMPVVEIGYAPLHTVRQTLRWTDTSVIVSIKALVVGATFLPPALGAVCVAVLLVLDGH